MIPLKEYQFLEEKDIDDSSRSYVYQNYLRATYLFGSSKALEAIGYLSYKGVYIQNLSSYVNNVIAAFV